MSLGELERGDGVVVARLTRQVAQPPGVVWALFADPTKLAVWLAPGRIEAKPGGRVRLDFADSGTVIDSEVTAYEAGRLVEFSWSAPGEATRPVRLELAADGKGTRLGLTLTIPANEDQARACAGWEAHLAMLEAALDGAPIKFPFEVFKTAREAYRAQVAAL